MSLKLALVPVLAVALYLGIRMVANQPVRDRTERHRVAGAEQQTHLLESPRGMKSLKVAGSEPGRRATGHCSFTIEPGQSPAAAPVAGEAKA